VRRFDEAIDAHHHAAARFTELGDHDGEGRPLNNLGTALQARGLWRVLTGRGHSDRIPPYVVHAPLSAELAPKPYVPVLPPADQVPPSPPHEEIRVDTESGAHRRKIMDPAWSDDLTL
jgi:hypothetical protein